MDLTTGFTETRWYTPLVALSVFELLFLDVLPMHMNMQVYGNLISHSFSKMKNTFNFLTEWSAF